MPRAVEKKLYRTFVKGLITEASPLTYPENASINEDNCIIYRKGNRTRRLGIDYEDDFSLSTDSVTSDELELMAIKEFPWYAVNNDTDVSFLVVQTGLTIHFYDLSSVPLSDGIKSFSIDLSDWLAPDWGTPAGAKIEVSMFSGKGYLFIVGQSFEPLLVEYDPDTDDITVSQIFIRIRDFIGVDDGLANDEEPTTLTAEHEYNLKNQGWINPNRSGTNHPGSRTYSDYGLEISYEATGSDQLIDSYFAEFSKYPGNNKLWWYGKSTVADTGVEIGDFVPALLDKFFQGNTRAPRGHFIVDAFNIDRSAASGVSGLAVETELNRPLAGAFFSGRAWYAVNSTVYFSQILDDKRKAGACYQEADPTAEDISDLIASDGGVIPIPEAEKIVRLLAVGGGLLVFATSGIWYVTGTSSGFSASDFAVLKISPIGTESPNSIVEAEGQIYYWSKVGVMGMAQKIGAFGAVEGVFDKTNISQQTIQSLYNNEITRGAKLKVKAIYDPATNVIQWMYRQNNTGPGLYVYDRILNLDLTLQAFYPWSISSVDGTTPWIVGGVQLADRTLEDRHNFIKYIIVAPSGASTWKFTFGQFSNTNFADWETFDGDAGFTFNSFVETGYELMEDAMRKKQTPYIFCYFRRTEETYVENEDGDFDLDKQSSCKLKVKWEWSDSAASNKWAREIEAYRLGRFPAFSESDLEFDNGFPVVVTKNKVRGSGRAIQFRFSNGEIGKDFDLLGWAVSYVGNTEP